MKLFKKILIIIAIGLVPILACDTDELIDLNKDPNSVTEEMDWRYFLTNAQLQTMENRYVNWRTGLIFSSLLIQHYSAQNAGAYAAGNVYIRGIIDHQVSYWDYLYPGALKTGAEGMRQTTTGGYKPEFTNTHNTLRIVYNMGMLYMTDYYGNVPYFSANRGIEGENFFFPTYDSQQDIYTREGINEGEVRGGLLWELDDAASKLASAGPDALGTSDLWYGGDLGKWRKLAYSLMLREAMRIHEVDAATSLKYINKAIAGGLMTSNADNCITPTSVSSDEWTNQNGYSRAMHPSDGAFQNNRLSKTLVDLLKGNNDPRLMIISGGVGKYDDCIAGTAFCDKDPANQIGLPNGYDGGDDDPAVGPGKGIQWWCAQDPECSAKWDGVSDIVVDEFWSGANPLLIDDDDPYLHMGYAEVCFLLAEIAQRGIASTPKSAAEHYSDGIRADMNRWVMYDPSMVIDEADISAFIAAHPLSAGEAGLEEIAWQHWLATFMAPNHYETFATWRRTGRPTLTPTNYPNNLTGGKIFRRYVYSPADASLNEENFKAGATLPNSEMTRVWWDMGYDGPGNQTMP